MFAKIKYYFRYIFRKCLDCGKQLSKKYYRGDVCKKCFDNFNGLTITEMLDK